MKTNYFKSLLDTNLLRKFTRRDVHFLIVIPAKAGIQNTSWWIPYQVRNDKM
ncbi:hypothetical protein [Kordia periserrulae]|uniref:hypothetical protein n=1 Tax=Kordia periserrulae TaxID=701523 RepID=UPI0013050250|nr:hypothetical protein [Kordia periserrulae]